MNVNLKHYTPLSVMIEAVRICWNSMNKSDSFFPETPNSEFKLGTKDKALIKAVISKNHQSVLEHVNYNFFIESIPRFILQEHVRHRISSISVQSTRYCLGKLKGHEPFIKFGNDGYSFHPDADKYVYLSDNYDLNLKTVNDLDFVRICAENDIPNDEIKQVLPEAFLCNLMWTINVRALRNYISLRTNSSAHFLIQKLAHKIYEQIPDDHKFLFEDCVQ